MDNCTHIQTIVFKKEKRKEMERLSLSNAQLQYTATTAYFTYKSVKKYILFAKSLPGTLTEAAVSFTAYSA